MERRKELLLIVTIILLVVTIIWSIAVYQHIQTYNRIMQSPQDIGELGRMYITPEPLFAWGNGPILIVPGCILVFAWIFLIAEWARCYPLKLLHACNL